MDKNIDFTLSQPQVGVKKPITSVTSVTSVENTPPPRTEVIFRRYCPGCQEITFHNVTSSWSDWLGIWEVATCRVCGSAQSHCVG